MRFWWRCPDDEKTAKALAAESAKLWAFAVEFMHGKKPLDDGAIPCNGNGPQLDFFLRHWWFPPFGENRTHPYDRKTRCQQTPAFVNVSNMVPYAVVHELVHSIELAYAWPDPGISNCPDDPGKLRWWAEATAVAADTRFEPGRKFVQDAARKYLEAPEKPIDIKRSNEGYEMYLLPYYFDTVEHGLVGKTWEKLKDSSSVVEAIARATGSGDQDGFAIHWPVFTKHLVNEDPWNRFAIVLDEKDHVTFASEKDLALGENEPDRELVFDPHELQRLSAVFYRARIGAGVRSLTFVNPNGKNPDPRVRIKALVHIADEGAHEEDWSELEEKFFCIDQRAQRVTEVVLAISNSEWQPGAPPKSFQPVKLIATNVGCWKFQGTASDESNGTTNIVFDAVTFSMHVEESGRASVTFSPGVLPADWASIPVPWPKSMHVFASTDGQVNWTWKAEWTAVRPDKCPPKIDASGSSAMTPEQGIIVYFNGNRPDLPNYREYFAGGTVKAPVTACGSTMEQRVSWLNVRNQKIPLNGVLSGDVQSDVTTPTGSGHHRIIWNLKPLREP